jgi:lipopolysaccharide biosynthesis glycosyltransferase
MSSIWIGFDPREAAAYAVTRASIKRHITQPLPVRGLVLDKLREQGLYWRPTERRLGKLYDVISEHEMATEFAISRFLVPHLAETGWALFMDCDMLLRSNVARVFNGLDGDKAVYCVKHDHVPDYIEKMDGQVQSRYARKNWSSFMIFNCGHPANKKLTPELVNTLPGRDLHRFCWLKDEEIGELSVEWNWLVGHSDERVIPKNVHFTDGGPWFDAFTNVPYAEEWRGVLNGWAEK